MNHVPSSISSCRRRATPTNTNTSASWWVWRRCHKEAEKEGFTPTEKFEAYEAPLGVVVGETGEVYVADEEFKSRIFEFRPQGEDVADRRSTLKSMKQTRFR